MWTGGLPTSHPVPALLWVLSGAMLKSFPLRAGITIYSEEFNSFLCVYASFDLFTCCFFILLTAWVAPPLVHNHTCVNIIPCFVNVFGSPWLFLKQMIIQRVNRDVQTHKINPCPLDCITLRWWKMCHVPWRGERKYMNEVNDHVAILVAGANHQ